MPFIDDGCDTDFQDDVAIFIKYYLNFKTYDKNKLAICYLKAMIDAKFKN